MTEGLYVCLWTGWARGIWMSCCDTWSFINSIRRKSCQTPLAQRSLTALMKYNPAVQALFLAALPHTGTRTYTNICRFCKCSTFVACMSWAMRHKQYGSQVIAYIKPPEMDKTQSCCSLYTVCASESRARMRLRWISIKRKITKKHVNVNFFMNHFSMKHFKQRFYAQILRQKECDAQAEILDIEEGPLCFFTALKNVEA